MPTGSYPTNKDEHLTCSAAVGDSYGPRQTRLRTLLEPMQACRSDTLDEVRMTLHRRRGVEGIAGLDREIVGAERGDKDGGVGTNL